MEYFYKKYSNQQLSEYIQRWNLKADTACQLEMWFDIKIAIERVLLKKEISRLKEKRFSPKNRRINRTKRANLWDKELILSDK